MELRTFAAFAAAVLLSAAGARAQAPDLANLYELEAEFDPADGALKVQGQMTLVADARRDRVMLVLNDALQVRSFTFGDGRTGRIEPKATLGGETIPGAQAIMLELPKTLEAGERLTLRFAYDGRLSTENINIGRGVVSPRWTELTMEALWYPVWFDEPIVRSEVTLRTPERYQLTAPGRVDRLAPGRWRLDPMAPSFGRITFVMSDIWTVERRALNARLSAALHTVSPEPRAAEILDAVGGAYALFERMFGPPLTPKQAITVIYANQPVGLKYPRQAYSTAGDFIVLDESPPKVQQDTLHHEVAHLWWSAGQPGTPDEFMSESVSEYLALRRGEQVWGVDWLKTRRAKMEKDSAAVDASLLAIDGFTPERQALLYNRGPVVLWALHDRIGAAAMDELLKAAYAGRVSTMPAFFELLEQRHGAATAAWMRAKL